MPNHSLTSTSRPVIYGTQGVISSGHYLTSMAGMRMMLSGGNAFDAIVAAGFAAAVTEPTAHTPWEPRACSCCITPRAESCCH